jgi:hypothetical protein
MTPARILRLLRATWPAPTRTGKRTPPRRACFERRRSRLRFDPRPPVVRQRLRVPLSPELVEQVRRGLDVREEERDRSRGQFPHPRIMTRRLKSNASHPGRTHYEVRVYSTELRSGARSAYPSPFGAGRFSTPPSGSTALLVSASVERLRMRIAYCRQRRGPRAKASGLGRDHEHR